MRPYALHLLPLLLLLTACQSHPTTPAAAVVAAPEASRPEPVEVEPAKPEPANTEYIEDAMVTVNGRPQRQLTTKQLTRQLGRPDSIAKRAVECGGQLNVPINGPDADIWYYGKTRYEVSGTQAMLSSFDVTSGKFQGQLGKLVLNQNTTLDDIRRVFPVSAKEADKPSTAYPGKEEMSLPFYYKGTPADESLLLLFKKGRLQQVGFWSPC